MKNRKQIYATTECCTCRNVAFGSDNLGNDGRKVRQCGDYFLWRYGHRETVRMIRTGNYVAGARVSSFYYETAKKVADFMDWNY